MARGKDLAALAGLAGLAYAMRNKDEAPKGKEDTGPGYKSTETRLETPQETIARSMKTAPLDGTEMYPSGVMGGASQPTATVKTMPKPVSTTQPPTVSDSRNLESGMSRGTRPVDPRNLEAGMSRGTRRSPTLMNKGGMTASKRADGIASKGKTKCKMY